MEIRSKPMACGLVAHSLDSCHSPSFLGGGGRDFPLGRLEPLIGP